jgi:hypothetical protein
MALVIEFWDDKADMQSLHTPGTEMAHNTPFILLGLWHLKENPTCMGRSPVCAAVCNEMVSTIFYFYFYGLFIFST